MSGNVMALRRGNEPLPDSVAADGVPRDLFLAAVGLLTHELPSAELRKRLDAVLEYPHPLLVRLVLEGMEDELIAPSVVDDAVSTASVKPVNVAVVLDWADRRTGSVVDLLRSAIKRGDDVVFDLVLRRLKDRVDDWMPLLENALKQNRKVMFEALAIQARNLTADDVQMLTEQAAEYGDERQQWLEALPKVS